MINVAINGFGRIGRMVLKAGIDDKKLNFVAVNDLGDIETMAHLLKYDSVHGKFPGTVKTEKGVLIVNNKRIKVYTEKDPTKLPWKDLKVDVVIESTGVFRTKEQAMMHIKAGAKKVLLSAPPKDGEDIVQVIKGSNDNACTGKDIISNASCTTNSLVPVVHVLRKEFGVEKGFLTTVHSYTNDQRILDLPHSDKRRSRGAALNIIPTTTGAAASVGDIFPDLKGNFGGFSIRVPTPCGSLTIFTCILKKEATAEQINKAMKKASETYLKGILEYSTEPLVSTDIIDNPHSSIFDSEMTSVNGTLAKIFTWYDNEWGFSNRMIDVAKLMCKK